VDQNFFVAAVIGCVSLLYCEFRRNPATDSDFKPATVPILMPATIPK
jgi:hypothetical protein